MQFLFLVKKKTDKTYFFKSCKNCACLMLRQDCGHINRVLYPHKNHTWLVTRCHPVAERCLLHLGLHSVTHAWRANTADVSFLHILLLTKRKVLQFVSPKRKVRYDCANFVYACSDPGSLNFQKGRNIHHRKMFNPLLNFENIGAYADFVPESIYKQPHQSPLQCWTYLKVLSHQIRSA
jgi:hypothetical protein